MRPSIQPAIKPIIHYLANASSLHLDSHPSSQTTSSSIIKRSILLSRHPINHPSFYLPIRPLNQPSTFNRPSIIHRTSHPVIHPTSHLSIHLASHPSSQHATKPSSHPSNQPSKKPSIHPTKHSFINSAINHQATYYSKQSPLRPAI